jgi:transitional endoplasmic reticulum ATPase
MTSDSSTSSDASDLSSRVPEWFKEVVKTFSAGVAHGFILSGDVWGTTIQGISQRNFLQKILSTSRDVVAYYNRATGITFPLESMREKAEDYLASPASDAARQSNPFDSVLNAAGMGVQQVGDRFASARRPTDALSLLEQLLRAKDAEGKVAVIVDYAEVLIPSSRKDTMSPDDRQVLINLLWMGQDEELAACSNPIFLLCRDANELHPDLRASGSGYKLVEIPLPTREERKVYLDWYLRDREEQQRAIALEDGLSTLELANLTAGLTLRHLEDILMLGARAGGVSRQLVKGRKDEIISNEFSDIAAMIDPLPGGFSSMGGMEWLVKWLQAEVIRPIREGRPQKAPKGLLVVGPPGTGKTYLMAALGAEIGFNAVSLQMENILGGIVGQSEGQLKRFFAFARSLAPVLIFLDELDQSDMARRGTGSGNPVAANLFGMMLRFTSDESLRGKVLLACASNRPDLIDAALLRFGRFDAIIPVLLPDEDMRGDIIAVQTRLQGFTMDEGALRWLAQKAVKYSAADLAAVVFKAGRLAERRSSTHITQNDVEQAFRAIRPATPQIADFYTLIAVQACNDTELLPPEYARMLEDREALARKVEEMPQPSSGLLQRKERTL